MRVKLVLIRRFIGVIFYQRVNVRADLMMVLVFAALVTSGDGMPQIILALPQAGQIEKQPLLLWQRVQR
ncbi:MAG: hypothetical protein ACUVUR_05565 [bacterium]